MTPETHILSLFALTHGAALLLAVRELYVLRRRRPGPQGEHDRAPEGPTPTPPDAEPDLPPLPASLIPTVGREPARERVRTLEHA
jgi:hypothetical protein